MTWSYLSRRRTERVRLTEVQVSFVGVQGTWVADRSQQQAAWEMYVELVTRIAVQPLKDGLLREALSSLHSLFDETRSILKRHGSGVAVPIGTGQVSFGRLAVGVLNEVLRPVLSHWHSQLQSHESSRPPERSQAEHERLWDRHDELRGALDEVRRKLGDYADLLAAAAGVERLHDPGRAKPS